MTGPPWRASCSWRSMASPKKKLPTELGYGSGVTCWRRMREWADAGLFDQLHRAVLDRLGEQAAIDWSRAVVDAASVRAKKGAR